MATITPTIVELGEWKVSLNGLPLMRPPIRPLSLLIGLGQLRSVKHDETATLTIQ